MPCGSWKPSGGDDSWPIYVFEGKSYICTSLVPESLINSVFVYAQQSGLMACVPVTWRSCTFTFGETTDVSCASVLLTGVEGMLAWAPAAGASWGFPPPLQPVTSEGAATNPRGGGARGWAVRYRK